MVTRTVVSCDQRGNEAARGRKVIHATCAIHPGTPGYTNVAVTSDGGDIYLDPHATGACRLLFTLDEARELHAAIGELLR